MSCKQGASPYTFHCDLSQYLTNLMHKLLFYNRFYFMPLHVSSTLHSLWYNHTYSCDDTRGCVMQYWPPDAEHMCSKHVEAWNKTCCKTKFCASSWLNTEINVLRCTVSKTSKCHCERTKNSRYQLTPTQISIRTMQNHRQ